MQEARVPEFFEVKEAFANGTGPGQFSLRVIAIRCIELP